MIGLADADLAMLVIVQIVITPFDAHGHPQAITS